MSFSSHNTPAVWGAQNDPVAGLPSTGLKRRRNDDDDGSASTSAPLGSTTSHSRPQKRLRNAASGGGRWFWAGYQHPVHESRRANIPTAPTAPSASPAAASVPSASSPTASTPAPSASSPSAPSHPYQLETEALQKHILYQRTVERWSSFLPQDLIEALQSILPSAGLAFPDGELLPECTCPMCPYPASCLANHPRCSSVECPSLGDYLDDYYHAQNVPLPSPTADEDEKLLEMTLEGYDRILGASDFAKEEEEMVEEEEKKEDGFEWEIQEEKTAEKESTPVDEGSGYPFSGQYAPVRDLDTVVRELDRHDASDDETFVDEEEEEEADEDATLEVEQPPSVDKGEASRIARLAASFLPAAADTAASSDKTEEAPPTPSPEAAQAAYLRALGCTPQPIHVPFSSRPKAPFFGLVPGSSRVPPVVPPTYVPFSHRPETPFFGLVPGSVCDPPPVTSTFEKRGDDDDDEEEL